MWTKLSDDMPDDLFRDGLSDAAFRTHVEGLCWSGRHLLDGRLAKRTLRRFATVDDPDAAVAELVAAGYWSDDGDAWVIVHHLEHQPERSVVEHRRNLTAERTRRHRMHKAGDHSRCDPSTCNALRDALRDASPGAGRDGTGQDRREKRSTTGKGQVPAHAGAREDQHVQICTTRSDTCGVQDCETVASWKDDEGHVVCDAHSEHVWSALAPLEVSA